MDRVDKNKIVFVISHKYYRGYQTYIEYYVKNIISFYENALIIIVDNNSAFGEDVFGYLRVYDNVILLDNNINCKFELGAYKVGLKYLEDNNITDYDYVVFTQDNYVIKNRLDFNSLYNNNIMACTIVGCVQDPTLEDYSSIHNDCLDVSIPILENIGLYNNMDKISFCWCNSFILHASKIEKFKEFVKDIVISIRWQSCASERYLSRILWELNDGVNYAVDGDIREVKNKYDCHNIDLYSEVQSSFFVKKVQSKNENTKDAKYY